MTVDPDGAGRGLGRGLVAAGLTIAEAELDERFETSGGPGGQHANRNRTVVRLRFRVAESSLPDDVKRRLISRVGPVIETTAGEERSQLRNRVAARRRMAERIEAALREPKPRRPTKPTRASRERRLTAKRATSEKKRRRRPPVVED